MNEPSATPPVAPKSSVPKSLLVLALVVLMGFSLSIGGLTWWLLHRSNIITVSQNGNTIPSATELELFNGRDLEGWDFDPEIWSVRNGVIYGYQQRSGYGSSLFWHDAGLADFELHFRFRLVRGNSGIYYRASRLANFGVGGYEFEIYTNKTGNLADDGADREKRRLHRAEAVEPIDSEWHEGVIIANGPRLIHRLDGKVYCDVEDTDPAAPRTGAIVLAMTSSTIVEFKDLRLKRTHQVR